MRLQTLSSTLLLVAASFIGGCNTAPPVKDSLAELRSRGYVGRPVAIEQVDRQLRETWEQIKREGGIHPSVTSYEPDPRWVALRAMYQPGDEIRPFSLPRGGDGFALFRNGVAIAHHFTLIE